MGILDTLFGGGDQSQGGAPHPLGILGGLAAHLSPHAYEAAMQRRSQMADYGAMQGMKDLPPGMASAFAQDPGFRQQLGGAYFPAAPQTVMQTGPSGETFPLSIANPGGAGGHGGNVMDMPILPPGTTSSPTAAVSPQPNAGPQQVGAVPGPANVPKTVMTGGLPGSQVGQSAAIDKAKAEGRDPMSVVSPDIRNVAQQVLDGKLLYKDLESTRFRGIRTQVEKLLGAVTGPGTRYPDFNELESEAQNKYRLSYADKATKGAVGAQLTSLGALSGHTAVLADAQAKLPGTGFGFGTELAEPINRGINSIYNTPKAESDKAADTFVNEYSNFVSQTGASGVEERGGRRDFYDSKKAPQARGAALLNDVDFIEKRAAGIEDHRNQVFKTSTNPEANKERFTIMTPQIRANLDHAKIIGHQLKGDYEEWAKSKEGQQTQGVPKIQQAQGGGGGGLTWENAQKQGWK